MCVCVGGGGGGGGGGLDHYQYLYLVLYANSLISKLNRNYKGLETTEKEKRLKEEEKQTIIYTVP